MPIVYEPELGSVGVFSRGIARLPRLKTFVRCRKLVLSPTPAQARELDAVIGWGHKPTARVARDFARSHGLRYLALEDGFLRSVGVGAAEPPLSLVLDDTGIYYDAEGPSRLELLLGSEDAWSDPVLLERARRCRELVVESGISKYNHAPDALPAELESGEPYVLVADQTFGDASVTLGLAGEDAFDRMLEAALDEHPDARIVVKVHPETVSGKKRGYLAGRATRSRVVTIAADVTPQRLLSRARHVYVCTSQLGFEALLANVPVSCFGVPFYAGWGLTDDRRSVPRRTARRSLDELVAAALLLYPRYVHPITEEPCEAEEIVAHLALQRRMFAENRQSFVCFGFSAWKRPFVRRYLQSPGKRVRFVRSPRGVSAGDDVTAVVWSSRSNAEIENWARERGVPLWRMEDGFLRSVGLGSDLTAPGSLVLDRQGIYYDPTRPSDLELLLQSACFTNEELARARALRRLIVQTGISKYNAASNRPLKLRASPSARIVLVVGQVDDDASVRKGSPFVPGNLSLLEAVRAANPDAYVVYKPHPDVQSGNRRGAISSDRRGLWDELVDDAPIGRCLGLVHEVHTMTSLVGFEALLREIPVVTYGQPFYAGWGLTTDVHPIARRTRRLALDELVAGTLLRYPRYFSWNARAFCTAEQMVRELAIERSKRGNRRRPHLLKKLESLAISLIEWIRAQELFRAG